MGTQAAKLRKTLTELEAELEALDELDDESTALLRHARDEIEERLADRRPGSEPAERLRKLLAMIETRHPTLTRTINQLAEVLTEMGI